MASKKSSGDEAQGVGQVLGELDTLASNKREVRIGDVLEDFGPRSFGPFILIPALIEMTPIGSIPIVPTLLALIIALTAAQLLLGRDQVWMPQFIHRRSISGRRLHKAVRKLRGIAHWLDAHSHRRLPQLVGGAWLKAAAATVIVLCCTVPALDFVPFASTAPMFAIACIGLALTVRDGALMLVALVLAGAAVGGGGYLLVTR